MTNIDAAALCSDWLDLDTDVTSTFAKSDRDRRVRSSAESDSMGNATDRGAPPAQTIAAVSTISCMVHGLRGTWFIIPRYILIALPASLRTATQPRKHTTMTE
jgi:hypothetical protein